jgi:hypothetical protein
MRPGSRQMIRLKVGYAPRRFWGADVAYKPQCSARNNCFFNKD